MQIAGSPVRFKSGPQEPSMRYVETTPLVVEPIPERCARQHSCRGRAACLDTDDLTDLASERKSQLFGQWAMTGRERQREG